MTIRATARPPGWQPTAIELADAPVIERWRVVAPDAGPYQLHGVVAGAAFAAPLAMIDGATGWALGGERLLVLGERAGDVCMALSAEVEQRAATAAAAAAAPPADDRDTIRAAVEALAERARSAGLPMVGSLLELAVLEMTLVAAPPDPAGGSRRDGAG